jgi:hypothetical protein
MLFTGRAGCVALTTSSSLDGGLEIVVSTSSSRCQGRGYNEKAAGYPRGWLTPRSKETRLCNATSPVCSAVHSRRNFNLNAQNQDMHLPQVRSDHDHNAPSSSL